MEKERRRRVGGAVEIRHFHCCATDETRPFADQNGADMARKEISPPRCGMVVVSASYLPVWWWWLPRDRIGIRCVGSRLTQSCVIKDTRNTAGQFSQHSSTPTS